MGQVKLGVMPFRRPRTRLCDVAIPKHSTPSCFTGSYADPGPASLQGRRAVSCPSWRTKPSWYLVTTDDRMIPPPAQRAMCERIGATTIEVAASHAVYVSQPDAVAAFISEVAEAVTSS